MYFNKPPTLWALVITEGTDSRREGAIEARGASLLRRWLRRDEELLRREGHSLCGDRWASGTFCLMVPGFPVKKSERVSLSLSYNSPAGS